MASASSHSRAAEQAAAPDASLPAAGSSPPHLKAVPAAAQREEIRRRAAAMGEKLDKARPMSRRDLELHARRILAAMGLADDYLGWTMVALASDFWREQVAAVPYDRRLLLLPHCLRNAEVCTADYSELGLLCRDCGACSLTALRAEAQRMGYRVMVAEGSPTVMQVILGGHVDALLGVACLDVLERTFDKILLAGIPSMAVPLLTNGCRNTSAEIDRVRQMVGTPYRPAAVRTRTYVHLMRCAARMFEPEELRRLVPPSRRAAPLEQDSDDPAAALDPLECTEAIAYDFLAAGGKHSRPFITLAVYDALCGGAGTTADGAAEVDRIPDAVRRIALAIEIFHKASLVHDDVEDDDASRYGRPALHRRYGPAAAVNVGDFLIGLGYRLVAGQRDDLGPETTADVLSQFARAHTKLCEGQGAELIWRDARQKRVRPLDALRIYALKTAPAFEAAIMAGVRLAGPAEPYRDAAARFARHLGVAYQIVNDLDDWDTGQPSKGESGTDILGGRPTVLWALAMEGLAGPERRELESLVAAGAQQPGAVERARQLYERAGVFGQVASLIEKHHQRAGEAADQFDCEPLRELLRFIADAILDRRPLAISEE